MKKQEQNTKETVSMLVYGYLVILFAGLPLYMQNKLFLWNQSLQGGCPFRCLSYNWDKLEETQ